MIDWIKCNVIGTGKEGDDYRPSIANQLKSTNWSVVYYPNDPPYQYCMVRIDRPESKEIKLESKDDEKLDKAKMKTECDKNPYFKYRWLDQPEYPAKTKIQLLEEGYAI